MRTPFFIAKRLAFSEKTSFSRFIIRMATVAVALSVAVMLAASALIAGFKEEISNKIFGFWGHIHITDTRYSLSFEPAPISTAQNFYPSLDTIRHLSWAPGFEEPPLKSKGGVRHIQAFAYKPGILRTKKDMEGIILKGIGADFDWENFQSFMVEGSALGQSDSSEDRSLIVSKSTADRLQVGIGDKIIVYFIQNNEQLKRGFQVGGIYKTGLEEFDRKFALCDIRTVQQLMGWKEDQVGGFEVWLDDITDMDLYNEYIYQEVLPTELLSVSIHEKFPAIFEWLALQDNNEIVVLALMLAVAIINMVTALLVLVLERTNMIGTLKALGESNSNIRMIFLYHAGIITLKGMFWGNLVGLGFLYLQDKFHLIKLNEADYYLNYAPVSFHWPPFLLVNIGTLLLILLVLLVPSYVVSRISPIKAIQFR